MMAETHILGIDPGLKRTGYAVVHATAAGPRLAEAGVIRSEGNHLADRLYSIHAGVREVVEQFRPQVIVVEQLYAHYAHPRTAILMGHARGVVLLAAAAAGVPAVSYNATRIKKSITGSGRADKDQVQRTIQREFGLHSAPEPADAADAIAAALCHYYTLRPPVR